MRAIVYTATNHPRWLWGGIYGGWSAHLRPARSCALSPWCARRACGCAAIDFRLPAIEKSALATEDRCLSNLTELLHRQRPRLPAGAGAGAAGRAAASRAPAARRSDGSGLSARQGRAGRARAPGGRRAAIWHPHGFVGRARAPVL